MSAVNMMTMTVVIVTSSSLVACACAVIRVMTLNIVVTVTFAAMTPDSLACMTRNGRTVRVCCTGLADNNSCNYIV